MALVDAADRAAIAMGIKICVNFMLKPFRFRVGVVEYLLKIFLR
jgi:hypothetical protein